VRLTLLISSLGMGGAEKVLSVLANAWAERGHAVTVLTLDDGRDPPFFPLHPAVAWRPLALARPSGDPLRAVRANVGRVRALRAAVRAAPPDVLVAFMDQSNVLAVLAARGLAVPVVICEHTNPATALLNRPWRALRAAVYPLASCLVVLTETARDYFPPRVRRRARVIPNPVTVPPDVGDPGPRRRPRAVALGRLSREKGFDLLLAAFALVADRVPDWTLTILGEGPERAALEAQRDGLGLRDRIDLPGATRYPGGELRRADLFVLPSRLEGFPMALCEGLASGLPAAAFDCPSGPRAILRDGIDGILVPPEDVPALAAAMARLMGDDTERRRMAARAPEVLDRFGIEPVLAQWDEVFAEVRR
jgi:GalNAc-alpha-(1->4)-GalNAc-alpha-(1->3)-diNAcBac-PP-undecaprenol alpha-1,4-N-acetyl-D-galactosaminyltransferase